MAARREFIEDVPFRAKDGREVWVALFVSPVVEDGRVVQARPADDPCRGALETAMGRLRRMGEVHALLTYRAADGPDGIDFPDYLRRLCRETVESLSASPGRVAV